MTTGPALSVSGLGHAYRGASKAVLERVSLDVDDGEFVCIVGPSGAGKTTLLRCLAGLQRPSRGRVTFDGATVSGPPEHLALVFQDYSRSLLPWLTVEGNVALPLRAAGLPRRQRAQRARGALEQVGLLASADLHPWQLSGGMQQRVAIARALAYRPRTLLMDEPFASVDAQTRADLEDLILRVRSDLGLSVVLVTHDIDEAVYLSDRVIVLSGAPASVIADIAVDLGTERDQITTKALPAFADLRAQVYHLIRRPGAAPVAARATVGSP